MYPKAQSQYKAIPSVRRQRCFIAPQMQGVRNPTQGAPNGASPVLGSCRCSVFIHRLLFTKGPVQPPLKGSWVSHSILHSLMQERCSCPVCSQMILLSPRSPGIPLELRTDTRYVGCTNDLPRGILLERWVRNDPRRG